MSAIARMLEDESRDRLKRMTLGERVEEALSLGRAAIEAYATANGVSAEEARRRIELAAQAGRQPSRVMMDIIG